MRARRFAAASIAGVLLAGMSVASASVASAKDSHVQPRAQHAVHIGLGWNQPGLWGPLKGSYIYPNKTWHERLAHGNPLMRKQKTRFHFAVWVNDQTSPAFGQKVRVNVLLNGKRACSAPVTVDVWGRSTGIVSCVARVPAVKKLRITAATNGNSIVSARQFSLPGNVSNVGIKKIKWNKRYNKILRISGVSLNTNRNVKIGFSKDRSSRTRWVNKTRTNKKRSWSVRNISVRGTEGYLKINAGAGTAIYQIKGA